MPSAFDWTVFVLCGLIRGTSPLLLKLAVDDTVQEPFLVVARSGPTVALFAIMMTTMYHNKEDYRENIRKHAGRSSSIAKMALMGFNTLIPFICFSWALNHISSATGGVLMTMTPIFALLFSQIPWLRGKNHSPLTSIKLTGMFISVLGVVCMFLDEFYKRDASPDVVPGFFVYLIGICSSASLGLIWKQLKGDMHYTLGTMGQSIFGGIYAIALWLVWTPTGQLVIKDNGHPLNLGNWLIVLYLGVLSGFGAVLTIYYLYDSMGVVRTQQVLYLVPIVSVLEAAAFNHGWSHKPAIHIILQLVGMALVMFGLRTSKAKSFAEIAALCGCGPDKEEDDTKKEHLLVEPHTGSGPVVDSEEGHVYDLLDEEKSGHGRS